jgi:chromosome segregation protein
MGADWVYYFNSNLEQEAGLATRLNAWQKAKADFFNFDVTYQEHIASLMVLEEKAKAATTSFEMAREHIAKLQTELHHLIQEEKQFEQEIKLLEAHVSRQKTDLDRFENQYIKMISDEKRIDEQLKIDQEQLAKEEEGYQSIQRELSICQTQLSEAYGVSQTKRRLIDNNQLQITKGQIQLDYLVASIPKNQLQEKTITNRLRYLESLLDKQSKELLTTDWFGLQKKAIGEQKSVVSDKGSQLSIIENDFKALRLQLEKIKQDKLQFMEKKWRLQAEKEQAEYHLKQLSEEFQQELQESLWSELDNDKTEEYYKKNMVYLENKLIEMGDINLLAAGLFEQEKVRYQQLVAQQNDLKLAMSELALAIHTLDADMQIRLQETLLSINSHLSVIFPQLFGGGEAKFVASCDNLLEATVAVHVQVPGKKQLRIQLLSGGEKALTAVALLFSIFSLNPAPFCLLDEVDAALDDANVQRLVSLIKALSDGRYWRVGSLCKRSSH